MGMYANDLSFIGSGVCESEPLCIPGLAGRMPMENPEMIRTSAVKEPAVGLGIHPVASIFPEMSNDEWRDLYDDIRDNGQKVPIVVHKGQVIDGRNRLRACAWLKIAPKTVEYDGREEDIVSYVMSLNLKRRNLSESQRAMVASKLETMKQGRPEKGANLPVSRDDAAKMLNVSRRSVTTAKQIVTKGEPEVAKAVEAGRMTLNEAAKVVQLRPEMQRRVADLPKAERRETLAANGIEGMELERIDEDQWGLERQGLIMALEALARLKGTAEQLVGDMPKYSAPDLNKVFGAAWMKIQALNAVYQNWEHNNVHDD